MWVYYSCLHNLHRVCRHECAYLTIGRRNERQTPSTARWNGVCLLSTNLLSHTVDSASPRGRLGRQNRTGINAAISSEEDRYVCRISARNFATRAASHYSLRLPVVGFDPVLRPASHESVRSMTVGLVCISYSAGNRRQCGLLHGGGQADVRERKFQSMVIRRQSWILLKAKNSTSVRGQRKGQAHYWNGSRIHEDVWVRIWLANDLVQFPKIFRM